MPWAFATPIRPSTIGKELSADSHWNATFGHLWLLLTWAQSQVASTPTTRCDHCQLAPICPPKSPPLGVLSRKAPVGTSVSRRQENLVTTVARSARFT